MGSMSKKYLFTNDELVEMYHLQQQGLSVAEIAERMGSYESTVKQKMVNINKYMKSNLPVAYQYSNLGKVITVLRSENQNGLGNHVGEEPEKQEDLGEFTQDVAELEKAFDGLKDAVVEFIIKAAGKRAENIVRAKEKELAEQKEKYEQELLKLQAIIAGAKDSSITGLLKRKWTELR